MGGYRYHDLLHSYGLSVRRPIPSISSPSVRRPRLWGCGGPSPRGSPSASCLFQRAGGHTNLRWEPRPPPLGWRGREGVQPAATTDTLVDQHIINTWDTLGITMCVCVWCTINSPKSDGGHWLTKVAYRVSNMDAAYQEIHPYIVDVCTYRSGPWTAQQKGVVSSEHAFQPRVG